MPCPSSPSKLRCAAFAAATGLLIGPALAQPATTLETVTITSRSEPVPAVGGWNLPVDKLPFQAGIYSAESLRDIGAQRLSDITRIDPAVSDAYNTEGYWDYLTVRGFVIDNRFNYRRDGLPINAETSIPLANKERVEVLKGTSGLQAGTSAPGGLVNLVVKRPLDLPLRSVELGWREMGSVRGTVDISQRFGADQAFGLRVNALAENFDPKIDAADGDKHLLALAGDWRIGSGTLVEAEFETSRQSQPSVPGFSLLGNTVPAAVDPRINLNNQPWSLPVVLAGNTGSLRVTQRISDEWRATAHLASQQLDSDDRIAFPFGCFDAASGVYYGDRYCPNGDFDLYDFRSNNERRRTDALELALHGRLQTGPIAHQLSVGALRSRVRHRFEKQAFNPVGTGNVNGSSVTPADPTLNDENTNRDEYSTELFVRDSMALTPQLTAWLGARHSRISRSSIRTDGSAPLAYDQSFTTPWLAASYAIDTRTMAYASWGEGIESDAVPNRNRYTNRGQALPALRSRQAEIGVKGGSSGNGAGGLSWGVALFDISRPVYNDIGVDCFSDLVAGTCTRRADGEAVHRGIEVEAGWSSGPWNVQAAAQWLHARRHGSADTTINGKRPTNVPASTLKLLTRYYVGRLPGLSLDAGLVAESDRAVLPDNSVRIPGFARIDVGLRFVQATPTARLLWRAGVDNLFDRRAWRESPYQFGHAYLFPMAARTFRVSVEAQL